MEGHAARDAEGRTGGKLLAAHRHLDGDGPPTAAQRVLWLVERFGCTPMQAIRELEDNPYIAEIVATAAYHDAYRALERWESATPEQRRGMEPPGGDGMGEVLARHRRVILRERMTAHNEERS